MAIPRLVAHRGLMARYPENTLVGLRAALESGACYVECDVQMNADGDFVVLHDDNFLRTAGQDMSVFSVDTALCGTLSVHEPARFGKAFCPQPVPLLRQVLDLIRGYPSAVVLVEIKEQSLAYWGVQPVMARLLAQLQPCAEQCIVISFDHAAITYVRQHGVLATGWVLHDYDAVHHRRAIELRPDLMVCNHRKLPPGDRPWVEFERWMLYDITDPELAITYGALGVELIETADIGAMLRHPQLHRLSCRKSLRRGASARAPRGGAETRA